MTSYLRKTTSCIALGVITAVIIGLAVFLGRQFAPSSSNPSQAPATTSLYVDFIDVGQGDAILIETVDGKTVLIDGGEANGQALAYLQQHQISHIDVMIVSHPHADHIGGLVEIMQAMPVGGVWTTGASHTTAIYEQFLDQIIEQHIPYHEVQTGDTISLDELTFAVLYGEANAGELNDTSLVLKLTYGEVSFLFTGDIESPVEELLVRQIGDDLQADILKVAHHGSATSSTPNFLSHVKSQVAIYSAGRNNQYGHPAPVTLENLGEVGATVYGTDRYGTIRVETNGSVYAIQTEDFVADVPVDIIPTQPPFTPQATYHPPFTPQATSTYDPFGRDRNCGAFKTHDEAQAFFIAAGGPEHDPHRLDGNNNGIACESLPQTNERDRDCGGFKTHAEAQAFFIAAGGPERDPHGLDANNNGIACESLP